MVEKIFLSHCDFAKNASVDVSWVHFQTLSCPVIHARLSSQVHPCSRKAGTQSPPALFSAAGLSYPTSSQTHCHSSHFLRTWKAESKIFIKMIHVLHFTLKSTAEDIEAHRTWTVFLVEGLGLLEGKSAVFPNGWMDGGGSGKGSETFRKVGQFPAQPWPDIIWSGWTLEVSRELGWACLGYGCQGTQWALWFYSSDAVPKGGSGSWPWWQSEQPHSFDLWAFPKIFFESYIQKKACNDVTNKGLISKIYK